MPWFSGYKALYAGPEGRKRPLVRSRPTTPICRLKWALLRILAVGVVEWVVARHQTAIVSLACYLRFVFELGLQADAERCGLQRRYLDFYYL